MVKKSKSRHDVADDREVAGSRIQKRSADDALDGRGDHLITRAATARVHDNRSAHAERATPFTETFVGEEGLAKLLIKFLFAEWLTYVVLVFIMVVRIYII